MRALLLMLVPRSASAQVFEDIGMRAQGMGGAFVALANDATATWWNPAGLASGPYFSGIVERGYARSPSEETRLGIAFARSFSRPELLSNPAHGDPPVRLYSVDAGGPTRSRNNAFPAHVRHPPVRRDGRAIGRRAPRLGVNVETGSCGPDARDVDIGAMVTFGSWRAGPSSSTCTRLISLLTALAWDWIGRCASARRTARGQALRSP